MTGSPDKHGPIVDAVLSSEPYFDYQYTAQNREVEIERARKYARMIAMSALARFHNNAPHSSEGSGGAVADRERPESSREVTGANPVEGLPSSTPRSELVERLMNVRVCDDGNRADAMLTLHDAAMALSAPVSATLPPEANQIATMIGLLRVAKCPACDGSGGIPHQVGEGEWEQEQCQWCDERSQINFGTSDDRAETKGSK